MSYTVLDIETTGSDPRIHKLVSVGTGDARARMIFKPDDGRARARYLMLSKGVIVAHTNYDLRWMMLDGAEMGPNLQYHDTKVMAWMLDATQALDLDSLAKRYLGFSPPKPIKMVAGRVMFQAEAGLTPIEDVPWDEISAYNASDVKTEALLYEFLRERLQALGLWDHFVTEEAPFSRLLIEMEAAGVPFDSERAAGMLNLTNRDLERYRRTIVAATGHPDFNPGSPAQVSDFLYSEVWETRVSFPIPRLSGMKPKHKAKVVAELTPKNVTVAKIGRDYAHGTMLVTGRGLPLPPPEKHASGRARPSVNSKMLAVRYGDDPWVKDYIEWRRLDKLRGYLEDWIEREHEGRLHCRFDQSGTVTGRLTCRNPNLQQVSGAADVRDLFRGNLVVGDYGGLEVRLSAHLSQDPVMLEIFRSGGDLYGTLASNAWRGPSDKTNSGRGLMKVLMLASQYGARGPKVAEILALAGMHGYTPSKSSALLRDLENTVPRLFEWREEVIQDAKRRGYVETIGGRKRHLSNLSSADWSLKASAERQAVNSLVQGSAADVVRTAMLECRKTIAPECARMILQVHDEILWERGPEWQGDLSFNSLLEICEQHTTERFGLTVPLVFEAKVADSWAAKGGSGGQVRPGSYATLSEALNT